MESSLIWLVSDRKESLVSPCLLYAGKVNHNADNFFPIYECTMSMWLLVTGHSVRCNYAQQIFQERNYSKRG